MISSFALTILSKALSIGLFIFKKSTSGLERYNEHWTRCTLGGSRQKEICSSQTVTLNVGVYLRRQTQLGSACRNFMGNVLCFQKKKGFAGFAFFSFLKYATRHHPGNLYHTKINSL